MGHKKKGVVWNVLGDLDFYVKVLEMNPHNSESRCWARVIGWKVATTNGRISEMKSGGAVIW